MELVWLVYVISLIKPVAEVVVLLTIFSGAIAAFLWIAHYVDDYRIGVNTWLFTSMFVLSLSVAVLLPSEKTAYTMVAAYATQKVAEAPETRELASDVLIIINSKVKQYALESVQELEKATKK